MEAHNRRENDATEIFWAWLFIAGGAKIFRVCE